MSNLNNSNNSFRYALGKGSKKFLCPQCGKRRLVRYIDIETGNYLPEHYGRCDRESKCSYHRNPYIDGYVEKISVNRNIVTGITKVTFPKQNLFFTNSKSYINPKTVFFDHKTFAQTLRPEHHKLNTFIQILLTRIKYPFEVEDVKKVIQLYQIGTISDGYRAGAVTFPFIDIMNNVRAVQVKQFNESNNTIATDFLHTIIKKENLKNNFEQPSWLKEYLSQEKFVSCLFGEHLLSQYSTNPIALVEAPKTAIYCTLYFGTPENPKNIVWLAVYNKSSFSIDKMHVLRGRDIYVFPDLSENSKTFDEWRSKANKIEEQLPGTRFIFSNLLENLVSELHKTKGLDIADFLIELDWRMFRRNDNHLESLFFQQDLDNQKSPVNDSIPVMTETLTDSYIENTEEGELQTIGEFFDLLKSKGHNKIPDSCFGIRAGNWESTKI